MNVIDIILIALGLSMDAFAVAVCKGTAVKKVDYKRILIVGLYFGIFQALMPLLGYYLGASFKSFIEDYAHWITFGLLLIIGAKMIYEAVFKKEKDENDTEKQSSISFKAMLPLAIATSIDAFAVGITFGALAVNIFLAVALIGLITLTLSSIGVKIGNLFGQKFKWKAEILGGVVLILIGVKILIESLLF